MQHQLPGTPGAQHVEKKNALLNSKEDFDSLYIHAQRESFANIKEVLVQQQFGLQQDIKNYADSFAGRY